MAREAKKAGGIRWRLWLGLAAAGAVCASTALAARQVRDFALRDPRFVLSRDVKDAFTIEGIRYASRWKVQRTFAGDFGRSVFAIPLAERRRRLLAIDWVEDAAVSRIWPDRLVVRIRERKPVAFVYFRSGVMLIDANGILLDVPQLSQFAFPVLSGIREDDTDAMRGERVRCLLRIMRELGDLTKDISEVNVADCDNVRIVTKVDRRAVELIMGEGNFARRFRNFLNHFPEIERRSPGAKVFDLRLADRIAAED